ncbi:hypothetical protein HIM_06435 [Hirsutella minnesotensis 3608]|uniref:Mid2 domain-containing protein n=1 Tax=Hirsutella minnesotensis 3608 TaxID=1043627 RepID=A0A0F8A4U8_9HYPO|nr:hypothetical protein HIM_06435 [Hirsutella minnesotensis 3608]
MQPTNLLPWSAAWLSTLGAVAVLAQGNGNPLQSPNLLQPSPIQPSNAAQSPSPLQPAASPAQSPKPAQSPVSNTIQTPPAAATPTPSPQTPQQSNTPDAPKQQSSTPDASKQSDSKVEQPTTTPTAEPTTITGNPAATTGNAATSLPSLTRGNGIPTYPAPTVPPTKDAPFMQHSKLPEGTVFIVVGAILGAFGLAILIWRSIVSLLLHRSVKRAAMAQHSANSKAGFPAPPAPFYKYTDHESTVSLSATSGPASGRGVRRTARGPIPSATPSHSNLFFSPTAANNGGSARGSTFLPSGFYAPGSSSGSPAPTHANAISLHNLRPDSRGHYTNPSRLTLSGSPPDSPQYQARREAHNMSASSLHLNSPPPGQRAPSAYLEHLLADDPGSLPPPHLAPSTDRSSSTMRTNSFPNRI